MAISAVINTYNEEKDIVRCLKSVSPFVDEIIVVDMESTDNTVSLARKFTSRIYTHKFIGYVEPARNYAISKAKNDWVLVIDADEMLPETLGVKLRTLSQNVRYQYYRLPHKNVIFGKWIEHTGWWPDYHIRFFNKSFVVWGDEIHSIPITQGAGFDIPAVEENAFIHHNYVSTDEYLTRLNRYTSQEARELLAKKHEFNWVQLLTKPVNEFMSRYFVWEGYKDGLHGLVLSILQGISVFIVYVKLWEAKRFSQENISFTAVRLNFFVIMKDLKYWFWNVQSIKSNGFQRLMYKARAFLKF